MKFKIGYRTIKTAVGTSLAIIIAQFFHLEFLYQLELSPFCAFKIQRKNRCEVQAIVLLLVLYPFCFRLYSLKGLLIIHLL